MVDSDSQVMRGDYTHKINIRACKETLKNLTETAAFGESKTKKGKKQKSQSRRVSEESNTYLSGWGEGVSN